MTSNQDNKQEEIPIPMTGIEVMNELSLDAHMMIYLASKGKLIPFRPAIHESYMKLLTNCCYDTAIDKVTDWRYRKSDVEEFKLKHKDFLEKLRKQIIVREGKVGNQIAESTQSAPEGKQVLPENKLKSNTRSAIVLEEAKKLRKDHPKTNKVMAKKQIDVILKNQHNCEPYSRTQFNRIIKPLGFPPAKQGKPLSDKKN